MEHAANMGMIGMDALVKYKVYNTARCANEEEIIRKYEQVRELCEVRDRYGNSILNKEEKVTQLLNFYVHIRFLHTFFFKSQMCNVKCV